MQDPRRLTAGLVALLLGVMAARADTEHVVRIMTWNLKWFPGGSPQATPAEQEAQARLGAAVVAAAKPDVLVLQEVRSFEVTEDLVRRAGLGLEVHVCSRFREGRGGLGRQQVAICSRFPSPVAWSEAWERGWANAPRGLAYARLEVHGQMLHVYGLHLKSNLGADAALNASKREDAVEQLLRHVKAQVDQSGADRVVIAGDFNTSFERLTTASEGTMGSLLRAGYFWTFEGVPAADRVTAPGHGGLPDACFDHVFLRNLGRPVAWVTDGGQASDHRPVLVEVRVTERTRPAENPRTSE